MIGVGKIGLVTLLEVRNVIAAQLEQPSTLQRVESLNDPRSAHVDRTKPALLVTVLVTVLRVSRPAIVERSLGVLDDLTDRGLDATRLPSVPGQPLVRIRLEEHRARLEHNRT
jgi:hypothetical protein